MAAADIKSGNMRTGPLMARCRRHWPETHPMRQFINQAAENAHPRADGTSGPVQYRHAPSPANPATRRRLPSRENTSRFFKSVSDISGAGAPSSGTVIE